MDNYSKMDEPEDFCRVLVATQRMQKNFDIFHRIRSEFTPGRWAEFNGAWQKGDHKKMVRMIKEYSESNV